MVIGCDGIYDKMQNREIIEHFKNANRKDKEDREKTVEKFLDDNCAEDC